MKDRPQLQPWAGVILFFDPYVSLCEKSEGLHSYQCILLLDPDHRQLTFQFLLWFRSCTQQILIEEWLQRLLFLHVPTAALRPSECADNRKDTVLVVLHQAHTLIANIPSHL